MYKINYFNGKRHGITEITIHGKLILRHRYEYGKLIESTTFKTNHSIKKSIKKYSQIKNLINKLFII